MKTERHNVCLQFQSSIIVFGNSGYQRSKALLHNLDKLYVETEQGCVESAHPLECLRNVECGVIFFLLAAPGNLFFLFFFTTFLFTLGSRASQREPSLGLLLLWFLPPC